MSGTTVTTSLDQYKPTIDLAGITIWEAMKLVDLLAAVSTILNAAIHSEHCSGAAKYLDDWQALFNQATFDIARVVESMRPTTEKEQNARNWLLANVALPCADGLVVIAGPGAPSGWGGPFTEGLIAARNVESWNER